MTGKCLRVLVSPRLPSSAANDSRSSSHSATMGPFRGSSTSERETTKPDSRRPERSPPASGSTGRSSARDARSTYERHSMNNIPSTPSSTHVSCEVPAHADHERELRRAIGTVAARDARIAILEKALHAILTAPCDANGQVLVGACACCLHDRMHARAALEGIE